ncbi:DUF3017 domain-containing protein [Streptomyces sp. NBC_01220]|uniref:DUF3017 domain-containing protein n=1 Tax=unclassified Streptomyces TaxID=2593676 RepID=UPI002E301072|nr:DUF3017 domain-containing protein [Streptomyces sp. NBC_01358]WSQ44253.1 DUF3017 domain-containing protein [Streptomyces sp. NBC_01220]
MGAGTSPADRAAAATGPADGQAEAAADAAAEAPAPDAAGGPAAVEADASAADAADGAAEAPEARTGSHPEPGPAATPAARRSRRFPSFTRDTARPEGGGRAAGGDAPAPARQWPLLAVLCTAGAGLLIVAADPFDQAFRIGTILIGVALIGGAVLRLVVPSVGMLAVRSRFTDLVTYGLLGVLIVMLSLVAQPEPWLDIPLLEDAVHFTIR